MVNNDSCCLAKILKVIEILQKNTNKENNEEGCSKPFLGPSINNLCYNTRPVQLYNRDGSLFTANYVNSCGVDSTSSTFRVEDVSECCAKLRILEYDTNSYMATNSFITVNLKCMCCVKCLDDIALDIC